MRRRGARLRCSTAVLDGGAAGEWVPSGGAGEAGRVGALEDKALLSPQDDRQASQVYQRCALSSYLLFFFCFSFFFASIMCINPLTLEEPGS